MQVVRQRSGKQFRVLRHTVDLVVRMEESGRKNPNNPHIEVMLQYYTEYHGHNKFKYDHTNCKWSDIDCIISNVKGHSRLGNYFWDKGLKDFVALDLSVYHDILFSDQSISMR